MPLGKPKMKSTSSPSGSSQGSRGRQESYVMGTVMGKNTIIGMQNFHSVPDPIMVRAVHHLPVPTFLSVAG